MSDHRVSISIVHYPGCMETAVQGLRELFQLANLVARQRGEPERFRCELVSADSLGEIPDLVILPPCIDGDYYLAPSPDLLDWLREAKHQGTRLCSVCAGAFILAAADLLEQRDATTHWMLAEQLHQHYPNTRVDSAQILVRDGSVRTAGGLMAWLDLGFDLVASYTSVSLMRQLGRLMVIDTSSRMQSYYRDFQPRQDHGDRAVLQAQQYLEAHYFEGIRIEQLAELCCLTQRTFLRRFSKATGHKPLAYLQQLRISKACERLEISQSSVEQIASECGYEDASAFRKTFRRLVGLTPKAFRQRFGQGATLEVAPED